MRETDKNHNLKSPVFVVGCARSGTTLLYHMLLSSGGFAIYRGETQIFNLLPPFFGDLRSRRNRIKLINFWVNSVFFKISGLHALPWKNAAMNYCTSYTKLLEIFMDSIALNQGVTRWAECTPQHLLHMRTIKKGFPEAKFIHIIRDGRDVALSLKKLGWVKQFPLCKNDLLIAALRWQSMIKKGRKIGSAIGEDYSEIHFEELVAKPREVLGYLSKFIDHDLDYDRIIDEGIGSVSKPNTAFKDEKALKPLNRWRSLLNDMTATELEKLIGNELKMLGYNLTNNLLKNNPDFKHLAMKCLYNLFFDFKQWTKHHTPVGRYGKAPYKFNEELIKIFQI